LNQLVEQGYFREDLFYRINVIPIVVPPLRERIEDIPILAEAFFRRIRLKTGKKIQGISNDAMRLLMEYSWPGNVRELRSSFEYAFVTCQDSTIQPYHFPVSIYEGDGSLKQAGRKAFDRDELKKRRLIEALKKCDGNQSKAADILGVSRVTVWNQIRRFNINLKQGEIG